MRTGEHVGLVASLFRCRLQCQINMNLVFHIPEDRSEIELFEINEEL